MYGLTASVEVVSNALVNMLYQSQPLCFVLRFPQLLSPMFRFAPAFLFDISKLLVCFFPDEVVVSLVLRMEAEKEEEIKLFSLS